MWPKVNIAKLVLKFYAGEATGRHYFSLTGPNGREHVFYDWHDTGLLMDLARDVEGTGWTITLDPSMENYTLYTKGDATELLTDALSILECWRESDDNR